MKYITRRLGQTIHGRLLLESARNPLYRNAFFLLSNTVFGAGLGFFFWVVVARFFTTGEVGVAGAVISAMNILSLLSLLGFNAAIIRFLPRAEKPVLFINTCLTVSGIASAVVAVVFFIGIDWWSPALSQLKSNPFIILAFISLIVVWTETSLTDSIFVAGRRSDFVLVKTAILAILKIPLPALLVVFFRAFGIAGSWGLAAAASLGISLIVLVRRVHPDYIFRPALDFGTIRHVLSYSTGSYIVGLIDSLPVLALPIIVLNAAGPEQNAYFYVSWMIATLLFSIPSSASLSLFAHGSHFEEELWLSVRQALTFSYLLLVPGMIVIFVLAGFLLGLYGPDYASSGATLLRVLVFSALFTGINTTYNAVLGVTNHIFELELLTVVKAVLALAGVYLVVPAMGITGIGYVWVGVQALASIYGLFFLKKRAKR